MFIFWTIIGIVIVACLEGALRKPTDTNENEQLSDITLEAHGIKPKKKPNEITGEEIIRKQ